MPLVSKLAEPPSVSWGLQASGLVIGVGLPIAMFFASRSAPAVVALSAILALVGLWQEGLLSEAARRFGKFRGATVWIGCCFVAYSAVSVVWSHFPATSAFAFGEFAAAVSGALVLGAAYSTRLPDRLGQMLAFGIAVAAIATIGDLQSGMWFRRAFGIRQNSYVLNRTVVLLLLLCWPMVYYCKSKHRFMTYFAGVLTALAIVFSESGATALGLAAGAFCAVSAFYMPRLTISLIAASSVAMLAVSPWLGRMMAVLFPQNLHQALANSHSSDRVNIWQSFGAVVEQKPVFGSGFGISTRMAEDPIAQKISEPLRALLGAGHPHDALLQIWVELGFFGAFLTAILIVLIAKRALVLRGFQAACVAGLAASILSIATVSHGAWQGWWIASAGCAIALMTTALRERPSD